MKLWILGANGVLGRTLQTCCLERRIAFQASSKAEVDITNPRDLEKWKQSGLTHIVNCAAFTNLELCEKEEKLAYTINARGIEMVGQFAAKAGLKVIHISTDYVFSGEKTTPYLEDDRCSPINVYGKSKLEGEERLFFRLPRACIIRSSWLFAKSGKNFSSSLLDLMKNQTELFAVSDQIGKPTLYKDLAEAIIDLLDEEGIFHFANSSEKSRFQMAQEILEAASFKGAVLACKEVKIASSSQFPHHVKRPNYSVLSTQKFERCVMRTPRGWEDVLEEYLEDVR